MYKCLKTFRLPPLLAWEIRSKEQILWGAAQLTHTRADSLSLPPPYFTPSYMGINKDREPSVTIRSTTTMTRGTPARFSTSTAATGFSNTTQYWTTLGYSPAAGLSASSQLVTSEWEGADSAPHTTIQQYSTSQGYHPRNGLSTSATISTTTQVPGFQGFQPGLGYQEQPPTGWTPSTGYGNDNSRGWNASTGSASGGWQSASAEPTDSGWNSAAAGAAASGGWNTAAAASSAGGWAPPPAGPHPDFSNPPPGYATAPLSGRSRGRGWRRQQRQEQRPGGILSRVFQNSSRRS